MTIPLLPRDIALAVAIVPFAYYLAASIAAARFFRAGSGLAAEAGGARDFAPPVSILKPVRGLDREAFENFASVCRQDYPGYEILFCASDENDPAVPVIRQLIAQFPARAIRLLIGCEVIGASDKVNKLARMAREARYDVLIASDSDVRLEPGFLRAVVAPFRRNGRDSHHESQGTSGIAGVTCLYRGITDGSLPANLLALGNSTDFAPGVLMANALGGLDFMLGAAMATTKAHLAEIGGFEAIADYFCDDYELGNRLAARGNRIALSALPVEIVYPRLTLREAFRQQVRWYMSVRFSHPWGHAGLLLTHGLFWTVLAILATPWPVGFAFAFAYLVLRWATAWTAGSLALDDPLVRRKRYLLPLRDAFSFAAWLASFFPRRIRWRDQIFLVRRKRLVACPGPGSGAASGNNR